MSRENEPRWGSIDWSDCEVVESRPDRVDGQPCLKGTRLKVATLIGNLSEFGSIEELCEASPPAIPDDVRIILEYHMTICGAETLRIRRFPQMRNGRDGSSATTPAALWKWT